MILLSATKRFGAPSAKVKAALESISDLGKLEQLAPRLFEANSWQELLNTARDSGTRPTAAANRARCSSASGTRPAAAQATPLA